MKCKWFYARKRFRQFENYHARQSAVQLNSRFNTDTHSHIATENTIFDALPETKKRLPVGIDLAALVQKRGFESTAPRSPYNNTFLASSLSTKQLQQNVTPCPIHGIMKLALIII